VHIIGLKIKILKSKFYLRCQDLSEKWFY